jgi:anthranilate phosphoribosyltransferase
MDAQRFIKEIGRGGEGARSLSYDTAMQMFESLFEGRFDDVELGAILIALRMKGESLDEVRAALDVLEPRLNRLPVDLLRPCVSIPSYNGARHTPNLVPLLACLLADAGVQVVVHGGACDKGRTTTAEIMSAMGLGAVRGIGQAVDVIDRGVPAFVPVELLSPPLAGLLGLRDRLGVRNIGHTLAKLMNPTLAPDCLRMASFTHPEFNRLQHDYFTGSKRPAMLMRGTEGEVVASTRRAAQIDWVHDGECEVAVFAQSIAVSGLPALPDAADGCATARWIQSALAGERPVPQAIDQQVGAVLLALGIRSARHTPLSSDAFDQAFGSAKAHGATI